MTPEQRKESEQATVLLHTAIIALGAKTVVDSLDLWQDVPPTPDVAGARATEKWLAAAVAYVMHKRLRARDLALAYYRYQRALTTGTTIALPGQDNPPFVTLAELKREFESYLQPAPTASESPTPTAETLEDSQAEGGAPVDAGEDVRVPVEEIDGLDEDLNALEDEMEQQVRENLLILGPRNQDKKINTAKSETVEQADADRKDAHDKAGNRQAAAAERNAMNGARGSLYIAASKDSRVLGWVRISRTGTPCGFCAMLISRGVVYRSERSAGLDEEGDLYHDNCHCIAVPVFSRAQYESDELFALNRKYHDLWPKVTRGLGGDAAISAWRRFIREEAKSREAQEAAA
jgi:hypothetical protein